MAELSGKVFLIKTCAAQTLSSISFLHWDTVFYFKPFRFDLNFKSFKYVLTAMLNKQLMTKAAATRRTTRFCFPGTFIVRVRCAGQGALPNHV